MHKFKVGQFVKVKRNRDDLKYAEEFLKGDMTYQVETLFWLSRLISLKGCKCRAYQSSFEPYFPDVENISVEDFL